MPTYKQALVEACQNNDPKQVHDVLDELSTVLTDSESCASSSTDCGYCVACNPWDPLLMAVGNNQTGVAEVLLSSPHFPVTSPSYFLRIAAERGDEGLLNLLLKDSRFFPREDPTALLHLATEVNHWRITTLPELLALPIPTVRAALREEQVFWNERSWMRRWEFIKTSHERGWPLDEPLVRAFSRPCRVVRVDVEPTCVGWSREPGACYHIANVYTSDGGISGGKMRGAQIREWWDEYIVDAGLRAHLAKIKSCE